MRDVEGVVGVRVVKVIIRFFGLFGLLGLLWSQLSYTLMYTVICGVALREGKDGRKGEGEGKKEDRRKR